MWSQVILSKRLWENRVMFCGNSFLIKIPSLYLVTLACILPWPHRTAFTVVMAPNSPGCFPRAAHSGSTALKKGQGVQHGSYLGLWGMLAGQQLCQMKCVGAGYGLCLIFPERHHQFGPPGCVYSSFTGAVTLFVYVLPCCHVWLMSASKLPSGGADGQHGCARLDEFV